MNEVLSYLFNQLFLSVFIVSILKFKDNQVEFVITYTILNSILCSTLIYLNVNEIIQLFSTQMIAFICLKLYVKDFYIYDMVVSFYSNILLLFSTFISILFIIMKYGVYTQQICESTELYTILDVISKAIFILLCKYTIKYQKKRKIKFMVSSLGKFLIFEIFIILLWLAQYIISYMLNSEFRLDQGVLFIGLIFTLISFVYILNQYSNFYEEYANQKIITEKLKLQKQKDYMIKNMKYEIDQIDHRMNYVLQSIVNDIQNKDYQKVSRKIQTLKDELNRIMHTIQTENETFDLLLNFEIQSLYNDNKKVKTGIFISKNSFYNDLNFCNLILALLQMSKKYFNQIELLISEFENKYVEVKLIMKDGIDENDNLLIEYQSFLLLTEYQNICFREGDTLFIVINVILDN